MKALALLKQDHQRIKQLFGEIVSPSNGSRRKRIFDQPRAAAKSNVPKRLRKCETAFDLANGDDDNGTTGMRASRL
jgi:hypothetical protein